MNINPEKKELLSVIVSFRNEEEVLPELINRITRTLELVPIEHELIFVNDNSNDNSLAILKQERDRNDRIKIINMSRVFGVHPSIIAGFEHASGNIIVTIDADLQDPPEIIPKLIEKWRAGNEVVHTTRTKRKGENFLRMWLTNRAYFLINFFSEIEIPKNTGEFKLLSRRAMNAVLQLNEYDPFFRGLSLWVGFKQDYVFYERQKRYGGKSHFQLTRSIGPYKDFIRGITTFSSFPLYISLFMGAFISLGAFIYLFKIIIERLFYGMHLPGWSAMMVTMLFLGGTILFSIGIQGIYIGKIHEALKDRPLYIIESKIGL